MTKTARSFGPPGSPQYSVYERWLEQASLQGLYTVAVSNGLTAQKPQGPGKAGLCYGFWSFSLQKGWLCHD